MITILFDLDGTLIDSTEAILLSFADSFKHFGDEVPSDKEITALIGHPLDFMFEHLGVRKERVGEYVDVYKQHYRIRSKPMTKLLPNAALAIEEAAKFARLGIVTTKTALYSQELLKHMGVMKYFEILIGREDVVHPKPHPEPIIKAMKKMDAIADRTWMIGDTCLDIVSANDAGVKSVALLSGYGSEKELKLCSQHVKKDAVEAVRFIKKANVK
jgi:phosphoglycolate phosphatase